MANFGRMGSAADYVLPGFNEAVAYFKGVASDFQAAYDNFLSVENQAATAGDNDYFTLKTAANAARATAGGIASAIDTVNSWLSSVGLNGLGLVQEIPALVSVGAITAAAAAMAYLIPKMQDAYYRYSLVQSGQLPAGQAFPNTPGTIESASNIVKWVVIGAAIYFLAPVVMKKLK